MKGWDCFRTKSLCLVALYREVNACDGIQIRNRILACLLLVHKARWLMTDCFIASILGLLWSKKELEELDLIVSIYFGRDVTIISSLIWFLVGAGKKAGSYGDVLLLLWDSCASHDWNARMFDILMGIFF